MGKGVTMGLKYIGKVKDISHNGHLVAIGEFAPRIGSEVFTGDRPLGRIVNIFGPISKPFISIKPNRKETGLLEMVGKKIYLKGG